MDLNRQKQKKKNKKNKKKKNDKIKFWKSVPSYVLIWQYQRPKQISFITSNKWENKKKNDLFYGKQIAYTGSVGKLVKYVSCSE